MTSAMVAVWADGVEREEADSGWRIADRSERALRAFLAPAPSPQPEVKRMAQDKKSGARRLRPRSVQPDV